MKMGCTRIRLSSRILDNGERYMGRLIVLIHPVWGIDVILRAERRDTCSPPAQWDFRFARSHMRVNMQIVGARRDPFGIPCRCVLEATRHSALRPTVLRRQDSIIITDLQTIKVFTRRIGSTLTYWFTNITAGRRQECPALITFLSPRKTDVVGSGSVRYRTWSADAAYILFSASPTTMGWDSRFTPGYSVSGRASALQPRTWRPARGIADGVIHDICGLPPKSSGST
ncbi:hypothetical protein C8R43DRAFT_250907 [Mycena crocata]|nr:hypothetical protein C8R43DRAFT_250907 [Mycena crocata]